MPHTHTLVSSPKPINTGLTFTIAFTASPPAGIIIHGKYQC